MPASKRLGIRRNPLAAALVLTLAGGPFADAGAQYTGPLDGAGLPVRAPAVSTSISGRLLWTNNVDLDERRRSDFVIRLTPRANVAYHSDRVDVSGSFALPLVIHTRKSDDSEARPEVNANARVEVLDDFFFVDASARVYTLYDNPFGAQPIGLENVVDNRTTTQWYSVRPFIRGRMGSNIAYYASNDSGWTRGGRDVFTNVTTASLDRDPEPFGWGVDLSRKYYEFEAPGNEQKISLARVRGLWQASADLRLQVSGGYEETKLPLSDFGGAIYGAGFFWQPTPRTVVDANWEERFFGSSYRFLFQHRWPRVAWDIRLSRDISSYPELVASLPENSFVPGVLDRALQTRIPDPFERLQFIREFMDQRDLPLFASDALAIYSRKIYLAERASTTATIFGSRNSLVITAYYLQTEPVPGDELLDPVLDFVDTRQVGLTATWSYQLSGQTTLSVTGRTHETKRTTGNRGDSDQSSLRIHLSRGITPRTDVFAGARYQRFRSDFDRNYNETAVFVGASHRFQ